MKRFSSYPRITPENDYDFEIDLVSKQKQIIERILKARITISGNNLSNLSIPQKRFRTESFEKVHSKHSQVDSDANPSRISESENPPPTKESSKSTFAPTNLAPPVASPQVTVPIPAAKSELNQEKPEIYKFELGVKRNNRDFNQDIELKSKTPGALANSESSLPKKPSGFSWAGMNTTGSETKVASLFEPAQTKPIFSSPFFPSGDSQAPLPTSTNFSGFFPVKVESNTTAPANPTPTSTLNEPTVPAKDFPKISFKEISPVVVAPKTETPQNSSNLFNPAHPDIQSSEVKINLKAGSLFSLSTQSSLFSQGIGNNSSLFPGAKTMFSLNEAKSLAVTDPPGSLSQQSKLNKEETGGVGLTQESKSLPQAGKTESLFQASPSSISTISPGNLFQQSVPTPITPTASSLIQQNTPKTTAATASSLFQQSAPTAVISKASNLFQQSAPTTTAAPASSLFEQSALTATTATAPNLFQLSKSVTDDFSLKNINYIPKSGLNPSPGGFFDVFKQQTFTKNNEEESSSSANTTKRAKFTDEELVSSNQYPSLDPISKESKPEQLFSNTSGTLKTEYITNPLIKKDFESKETKKPEGLLFSFSSTTGNSGFKNPENTQNSLLFSSKTENSTTKTGSSLFSNTTAGSLFGSSPASTSLLGSNPGTSSLIPSGSLFGSSKPAGSLFAPQPSEASSFGGSLFAPSIAGSLFGQNKSSFPGIVGQASQPSAPPVKLPSNISSNPFFVQKGENIDDKAFLEEEGYASGASGSDEDI